MKSDANTGPVAGWHKHRLPQLPAILALCCIAIATPGHSQGFGTVTPGGVQPQTERRSLPTSPDQPVFEVPAVPDRPIDADEGPKLVVTRFQLEGVADIPDTRISQVTISRLLEKIREAKPEGFTVGQLQGVANEITLFYRQQGFILAQAYIPQQEIKEGVVVISVLPGQLGQLSTANNKNYSDRLLKRPFEHLVGQPVQAADVESALLRLDDLPGLDAFGVFRPGKNIGETELILNAKTETPFRFIAIADNHGVQTTGENRLLGSMIWNNPLGNGDKLSLTALQTFDPEDSTYGAIHYESLIFSPALSAGFSYSTNDYAISQGANITTTETDGETQIASLFTQYSFIRSRTFNLAGKLDFSSKSAEVDLEIPAFNAQQNGEDKLSVFSTEVIFDSVDSRLGGGINEGSISYHQGLADFAGSMDSDGDGKSLRAGGSGDVAGGDFQKIAFDVTRLQLINPNNVLLLRLEGQYSDDLLSSIEQYSMGGPNSVRAYPVSEYIRDKALFASAEWIISAPGFSDKPAFGGYSWGEVLQLSFFVDYAKGRRNDPQANEKSEQNISGAGIGLGLNLPNTFFVRVEAATPISSQDASNGDNPQLWLSAGFEI